MLVSCGTSFPFLSKLLHISGMTDLHFTTSYLPPHIPVKTKLRYSMPVVQNLLPSYEDPNLCEASRPNFTRCTPEKIESPRQLSGWCWHLTFLPAQGTYSGAEGWCFKLYFRGMCPLPKLSRKKFHTFVTVLNRLYSNFRVCQIGTWIWRQPSHIVNLGEGRGSAQKI